MIVSISTLADRLAESSSTGRVIAAIAGPPGSGKSAIAEALRKRLVSACGVATQILPMDGFHYDDQVLEPLGLLPRKGSPETFDVAGLASMLGRLSAAEPEDVAVPVFDRELEIARAGARIIGKETRIVLVEGNYLLFPEPPWSGLRKRFDATAMIECDMPLLRERLIQRWLDHGFPEADAVRKAESNDLPNAALVAERSGEADFALRCDEPIGNGQRAEG